VLVVEFDVLVVEFDVLVVELCWWSWWTLFTFNLKPLSAPTFVICVSIE
jgi:hypothetical protein